MSTSQRPITKTKDFLNWIKGSLAVLFARDGLTEFVKNEIHDFHQDLIKSASGKTCSACRTVDLLDLLATPGIRVRGKKYDLHDSPSPRKVCPNSLCDRLMEDIQKAHRYHAPTWKNSDATRWCTDCFEICKCFLPPEGYSDRKSLADVDLNGLLAIVINLRRFEQKMYVSDALKEATNAVLDLRHTADYSLSDETLARYIDILIELLQDPVYLVDDENAREAVKKMKQLKSNNLIISTHDIKEVLVENLNVMYMERKEEILNVVFSHKQQASAIVRLQIEKDDLFEQLKEANQEIEILRKQIQRRDGQSVEEPLPDQPRYSFTELLQQFAQAKETNYWNYYLSITEEEAELLPAELLKIAKMLPNQDQLNKLHMTYLKTRSSTTSDLLKCIDNWTAEFIMKINRNISYVWLAYMQESKGESNVKLILEMEDPSVEITLGDIPYKEYKVITVNSFNDEAKRVYDQSKHPDRMTLSISNEIKKCIEKNASRLMKDHKHLSIINSSSLRSKGFSLDSTDISMIRENCLVLYVRKKGFIPIGELPFETMIDGFPTDVREGMFFTHMQASNESEETLRMGCRIYKRLPTSNGADYKFGTLGGFIDHPQYGLCGLTCAHVLLNDIEMTALQVKGELTWLDFVPDSASVYLMEDDNNEQYIKIGRLVKATLTNGDNRSTGMEAAIFQIERFFPSSGSFVNVTTHADDPIRFDSGKAYGPSRFSSDSDVCKYGSTTGKTTGKFQNQLPVITVRLQSNPIPEPVVLHNQIEIKGIDGTLFSDKGDSGAMVMIDGHNGERVCIGIVEGGTSYGTTIVTPIIKILDKMDVSSLKCFEADHLRNSVRTLEETTRRLEEKSDEILKAIRQLNVRP